MQKRTAVEVEEGIDLMLVVHVHHHGRHHHGLVGIHLGGPGFLHICHHRGFEEQVDAAAYISIVDMLHPQGWLCSRQMQHQVTLLRPREESLVHN